MKEECSSGQSSRKTKRRIIGAAYAGKKKIPTQGKSAENLERAGMSEALSLRGNPPGRTYQRVPRAAKVSKLGTLPPSSGEGGKVGY